MEELVCAWATFCQNMLESYKSFYKDITDGCINNIQKFELINEKNNIFYFNGYLRGYEAAIKDYKGLSKEPTDFCA
jgi:hypothetical protein